MSTDRAQALREALAERSLDAVVVTAATNIRYLSGFTGSSGTVVVRGEITTLITDGRYRAWAAEQTGAHGGVIEVVIAPGKGRAALQECLDGAESIGLESEHISWADATELTEFLGSERVEATAGLIEGLREIKSDAEVLNLRAAAEIGDVALDRLADDLRPGISEIEVARRLAQHMYDHAGALPSFDIIVASGPNAARPHHQPSDRLLASGDLVIIDSGATVEGYRSDMTRTFVLGAPTGQQQEMLDVVQKAQQAGVNAVAPGVPASNIDAACRSAISEAGLGDYFTHGTGHGVGLDIHEAPSVSSASTATLAPGHIITVEPGVYIPDVGGVRWEDTVLVTTSGADPLTRSPKQPIVEL